MPPFLASLFLFVRISLDDDRARAASHDHRVGQADEQSVVDDAGHRVQAGGQSDGVLDPAKPTVQDVVPLVGHQGPAISARTQHRLHAQFGEALGQRLPRELHHLDRQRKLAESRHLLVESTMMTTRRLSDATTFSRSSAPPPPLMTSARIGLVGAVDRQVQSGHLVETEERDAFALGELTTLRRRHAAHAESLGTRRPSSSSMIAAVEPDPSPKHIPSRTYSRLSPAASRFS